jgi:hypothetical protein
MQRVTCIAQAGRQCPSRTSRQHWQDGGREVSLRPTLWEPLANLPNLAAIMCTWKLPQYLRNKKVSVGLTRATAEAIRE